MEILVLFCNIYVQLSYKNFSHTQSYVKLEHCSYNSALGTLGLIKCFVISLFQRNCCNNP